MNAQHAPQEPGKPEGAQKIHELFPAYALGATDADEAAAVLRALSDETAAAEAATALAPYRDLAELLLYSAPPVTLPAGARARLAAAVEATAQPPAAAHPVLSPALSRPAPASGRADAEPRAWHWPKILAVAALIAAALLLLFNLYAMREIDTLRTSQLVLQQQLRDQAEAAAVQNAAAATQVATLAAQVAAQEQKLAEQSARLVTQQTSLAQLITGESERYTMQAVEPGSPAVANVAWVDADNLAILSAEGFPPLEEGKAYQLWLIRGDTRKSGGLFTVDDAGCGMLIFHPEESLEAFDGMGITPEPSAGSPGPTAPPVVRAQL